MPWSYEIGELRLLRTLDPETPDLARELIDANAVQRPESLLLLVPVDRLLSPRYALVTRDTFDREIFLYHP